MRISSCTFSIFFPPLSQIRESIFSLEKNLASLFASPFTLIPLPNEAPPEIPRITARSPHGYSNLNISLNSAQISTVFDDNFANDWAKCIAYVKSHAGRLTELLLPEIKGKILFCGLITTITEALPSGKNAVELLSDNFVKLKSSKMPYDLFSRMTFVTGDKFYVNLTLQNQRLANGQPVMMVNIKDIEKSNVIEISYDVNDRFAYNYNPSYVSGNEQIAELFKTMDDLVINKSKEILYEGKFQL